MSTSNELLAIRKFSDRLCPGLERKGMRIDRASARQGGRNSMIRTGDEPHDDPLERIAKVPFGASNCSRPQLQTAS
jgi:hypothetical protein